MSEKIQVPKEEEVKEMELEEEEEIEREIAESSEPLTPETEEEVIKKSKTKRELIKRYKDKDLFETVEEVFDSATQLAVYELMRRGIIRKLAGVISAGKEARVYYARGPNNEELAVKIYLTTTAEFRKSIRKYILGDPRFEQIANRGLRHLIYAWARKEYRNLKRMYEAGVRVPKPYAVYRNVIVMEFIGKNMRRAPLLKEVAEEGALDVEEWKRIFEKVIDNMVKMYQKARLVHADLSEYNIMYWNDEPVIIDVGQAVPLNHPYAEEFLMHDVKNIVRFFRSVGVETPSVADLIMKIKGEEI